MFNRSTVMKSAALVFTAVLMSGCATGHLYVVQGPLKAQAPPPIYSIKTEYGDQISARLAKGDVCHGNWLDVVKEDPSARELSAEWDLVYGKGFFLANVYGHVGIARATLTCGSGTKVTAEFDSVKGVARDDSGNVFKLAF
jgi:hypothetical protein